MTEINEKQIARFRRENLGFVFQDFNLLDTLTISENIALALTINKVPAGEIDGCVREMAGKLNITDILDKYPYQVSGGQKQRCACARAIIIIPALVIGSYLLKAMSHTLFIASYDVPVFDNLTALIALVVLRALLIFTLIYLLYAFIASQSMRKEIIPLTLEK